MGLWADWRGWRAFRRLPASARRIVFYAESGQDWHHLRPLVERLADAHDSPCCYVTSDPRDPAFDQAPPGTRVIHVGASLVRIWLFQFLRADVLILTMMDLGNLELKRSIHPVHYVYVFHSPASTHMVDPPAAYDHYDTLLCVGPHQVREIRARESQAGLPPKQLIEHGYHRLDQLIEESERRGPHRPGEPPTVLLAPTWGEDSILNACGQSLLAALLDADMTVVLRPHYESRKRHPEVIAALLARFGEHPGLRYVDRMGESQSLFDADVLITDWSGIGLEFGLGLARPVLYVDVPRRVRNPDYQALGLTPVEVSLREQLGTVIAPAEVADTPACIRALLAEPARFAAHVARLREAHLFNIGGSAAAGAREIAAIAKRCAGHAA
ncbi:CDP-glycerol glycerophosphotransferase family protein [Spectribacter hydrogenooxidans]|uniref:CDP-glycerol glycerophosphotransferase family protein n=1 Tax=Spectribacter hydrogenoxidans TaxID=3075608 RepID=A0ABU3C0I0_9GAMM|nr:CDP-glycerol glycerophosphotransferase family protein [Salinisphaera sp. W335]MDT0635030.1 CDP-glycerol glycerophosphotransferase family protein [Salinisphaera sp. W335]